MDVFKKMDDINPVKNKKDKFLNVKDLEVPHTNKNFNGQKSKNKNLVVVAHVWDDLRYSKYLYLSLLSQYRFTDIANFDLKIFFSSSLKKYEKELFHIFSPFTKQIYFKDKRFKYWTSFYEETTSYDVVSHIDSDLTFCGTKKPFYKKLHKKYKKYKSQNKTFPYICFSDYRYKSAKFRVYFHLSRHLHQTGEISTSSYSMVKNWILDTFPFDISEEDLDNWIDNSIWPWNVFYAYERDTFSSHSFRKLVEWWYKEASEWWEEEKLYWFWINLYDYPVETIESFFDGDVRAIQPYYLLNQNIEDLNKDNQDEIDSFEIKNTLDDINWKNGNQLNIVHPIEYHKDLLNSQITRDFYKFIIKECS